MGFDCCTSVFVCSPVQASSRDIIYNLTKKRIFFLTLVTKARVSELHALNITRIRFEHGTHRVVHLGLCWDFMVKNPGQVKLPGQTNRAFSIPPLSSNVGTEDEETFFLPFYSHIPDLND